jgi:hypothetical protein
MLPRPVRNNNPGDLEAGDHWQGLMAPELMTDVQKHERFAVFSAAHWGFRALVVLLRNYKLLYGLNTVRAIVSRFAPPVENPTTNYAETVAHALNVKPDDKIDLSNPNTMFALAKAVTKFETGSWEPYWTDRQLSDGMVLAGCERPQVMT